MADEETFDPSLVQELDERPDNIMPGLCMGSMLAEMNAVGLTNAGVTHVLCVADKLRNSHPSRFTYHNVAMDDDERQDALQYFKECFEFIDSAIAKGGKVFVHCAAGVSRSGTVVVAYVMWKQGVSMDDAMRHVQDCRQIVCPNPGFLAQLFLFDNEYQKDVNADFRGWRQHWKKLQDAGILAGLVSKYNPWAVGPTAQLLGGADGRML